MAKDLEATVGIGGVGDGGGSQGLSGFVLAASHPAKIDRERTEAGTCRRGGDTRVLPGILGMFHIFPE